MNIKVLTYNIHKCVGGVDRRYDLGRIVEIINHHQPDIALLQEVVRHSKSLSDTLQVDVIGEAIGLPIGFGCQMCECRRQEVTAMQFSVVGLSSNLSILI